VRVSTSQPSVAFVLQSAKPMLHVPIVHAPATHALVALAALHARPHIPQFVGLVRVSTSQPSDALPLQSAKPALHVNPHAPAAHVAVALAGAIHDRPHVPQLATVVARVVSQPFAGLESQSPKPMLQRNEQTAALQTGAAFARAGHGMLQPPQCAVFVRTFASQPLPAMPSQLSKPTSHTKPHADAEHVGVPFVGSAHTRPHAPQCSGFDVVSTHDIEQFDSAPQPLTQPIAWLQTGVAPVHALPHLMQSVVVLSGSQPLDSSASQLAEFAVHDCTHRPVAQLAVVLRSGSQRTPHPMQFSAVLSGASQPSEASALQSSQPASHVPIVQRPAVHAAVACANVQRKPQAPQLFGSFAVTVHASPHTTPASHAGGGGPASASASASIATVPSGAAASGRTPT
jgi:hypothetical protein